MAWILLIVYCSGYNSTMKILISGAGPAGLTLAFWLEKNGHQAVVVEQASSLPTGGYMIDFIGSGWDVIEPMGLLDKLFARQRNVSALIYENSSGKTQAKLSMDRLAQAVDNAQ